MLVQGKENSYDSPRNFQQVFYTYYPVVCRQAAYLLGSTEAVEDIAQETFLKLYYSSPGEIRNVGGWLGKVAANLCYSYLIREKSRSLREANVLNGPLQEKVVSLEETFLRNHEVKKVQEILAQLNERDRMVLLLKFSGYRYKEMAEIIEVETNSVGSILARALTRFKNLYVEREGGDSHVF